MRENSAIHQPETTTVRREEHHQLHFVRRSSAGRFSTALCGYKTTFSTQGATAAKAAASSEICPVCALLRSALPE